MDTLTPAQRKKNMQHIRSKDTKIEVILRKALWARGIRYRKNYKKLAGTPDIVLTKYKIAIFCDGEFFHGRDWQEQKLRIEKGNNPDFWINKIERNIQRDGRIGCVLQSQGWSVLRFWGDDIKKNTGYCVEMVENAIKARQNQADGGVLSVAAGSPKYGKSKNLKVINVVAAVIIRPFDDGKKRVFVCQRGYGKFKG